MRKTEVLYQIQALKATKRDAANVSCATELIRATGYVNIIDMLLLPLYYAWELFGFGKLEDVCFETYLSRTYKLFCQSKSSYIQEMVSLLRRASVKGGLAQNCKQMVDSLIAIYTSIIMKL